MVADTNGRYLDLCGWFADLRSKLPDSPFYLYVVLKCDKGKTRDVIILAAGIF